MLGLGAGSAIVPIRKKYPGASFTVVEIDPDMVTFMRTLNIVPPHLQPEIVIADAAEYVASKTSGLFDLILCDLFKGPHIPDIFQQPTFFTHLAQRLAPSGVLVVNVFQDRQIIPAVREAFSIFDEWMFEYNALVAAHRLPDPQFVSYRTNAAYVAREFGRKKGFTCLTSSAGESGVTWNVGPLRFERWYSVEPPEAPVKKPCLQLWQPTKDVDRPRGWWPCVDFSPRQTGHMAVKDAAIVAQTEYVKRHMKQWGKIKGAVIRYVQDVDHLNAPAPFVAKTNDIKAGHPGLVRCFLAENELSGELYGVLTVVDVPEISVSVHYASFLTPAGKRASAGTALIMKWYESCAELGFAFADFDLVWSKGDPSAWKGYSEFKLHFRPQLIRHPHPLVRLVL
jgi:SAM-dependent methyltransferase